MTMPSKCSTCVTNSLTVQWGKALLSSMRLFAVTIKMCLNRLFCSSAISLSLVSG